MTKEKLENAAFEMFREYTAAARKNSHLKIEIIDESILVDDLLNTITSAKKALLKKENKTKRFNENYDLNFMLGFISGKLNTIWASEYLIKQSDLYKEFIAIKAIKLFLQTNEIHKITVADLYNNLYFENLNLVQPNTKISTTLTGNKEVDKMQDNNFENEIMTMLENKINEYIKNYLNTEQPIYLKDLSKYFTSGEIQFLIDNDLKKLK